MKQVLQNRKTGKATVVEVPAPALQRGRVLVRTVASLISAGTERASIEIARKGLVQEARERPDLVKAVIEKARTEGLRNTIRAVRNKLEASQGLGYSAAGIVTEVGSDVKDLHPGDRVACAGVGFASHAEILSVPRNLCVRLPEQVDFDAGAFGTLGAIALQGLRLAEPTLGESIVVLGLGLVGQLTVQLLKANGCRVFGIDLDPTRVALAKSIGADAAEVSNDDTRKSVMNWSRGRGVDAVLITAATDSNQPIEFAGEISRLKGRVVVVGMTGLAVPRASYFSRELSLKISMSYGPGRYDPEYEERGNDYPFAYVRWTENRNIEAFLDMVAEGRVNLESLITHRFAIEDAERAYQLIARDIAEPYLGVVLRYDPEREVQRTVTLNKRAGVAPAQESVRMGLVGAGAYAQTMLLPHFKKCGAEFRAIATASGVTAYDAGKKFAFARAVSGAEEIIGASDINLVVIATRHDAHAELAQQALVSNQHVFVEKPLALDDEQLDAVLKAASASQGQLMVGFNRRFSPLARRAKEFFSGRQAPLSILYRVNAGHLPPDHWSHDPHLGGGRIVGEVCHFIDLMQYWIEAPPVSVFAASTGTNRADIVSDDSVFITLRFADGSNGCVAYLGEGDRGLPKERAELFCESRTFVLNDFEAATVYLNGREEQITQRTKDKGHAEEVRSVCGVVRKGEAAPITLAELEATTRATFRARDSLRTGLRLDIE